MQELLDDDFSDHESTAGGLRSTVPPPFLPWLMPSNLLPGLSPGEYGHAVVHPPKSQMLRLWNIFEQAVLPVVKVFHGPTTKALYESAAASTEAISPVHDVVLFSIYYSAIVSLSPENCKSQLGEDQARLLNKYRRALEQCLWRVDFLNTSNLMVLQAFIMFIISVRRGDDTRLIVTWTATAIRIAQFLGLHRDGTKFGLDVFQTEMRRRIWAHLVLLDIDSARDHGIDPLISECASDTCAPLNIDDDDIYPEMPATSLQRQGFTDMTHCIARLEISHAFRRLAYSPPHPEYNHGDHSRRTIQDKAASIRELQQRLKENYLDQCDHKKPLQFATAVYIHSSCAMLWAIVYHPLQRTPPENFSEDIKDWIFSNMVEVIENTRALECNHITAHWGWWFHNDVQWPAIAYVLNELMTRPPGPSASRAWNIIDAARRQWDANSSRLQKGMLWRVVKSMTAKAGLLDATSPHVDAQPSTYPMEDVQKDPQNGHNSTQASTNLGLKEAFEVLDRSMPDDSWLLLGNELLNVPSDSSSTEANCPDLSQDYTTVASTRDSSKLPSFGYRNPWLTLMNNDAMFQ
jgi:hypothetical protein